MNIIFLGIVYLLQFFLAFTAMRVKKKKKKGLLIVQAGIFGVVYGMRGTDVGHDTIAYYTMYQDANCFQTKYTVEPNFAFLVSILRKISINVEIFVGLLCLISVSFIALACYNFMKENMKYMNLLYVLIFCMPYTILMQVNVVRQGIALSILLFGLSIIYRKKLIAGLIVSAWGCSFHYSAIVILIAFLFFYFIKSWKADCVFTILFVAAGFLMSATPFASWLVTWLPENALTDRLLVYAGESVSGHMETKMLYYLCYFIFVSILYALNKKEKSNMIYQVAAGTLSATALISFNPLAAARMVIMMDLLIPFILLQPETVELVETKFKSKLGRSYRYMAVILCVLIFVVSLATYTMRFNLNLHL